MIASGYDRRCSTLKSWDQNVNNILTLDTGLNLDCNERAHNRFFSDTITVVKELKIDYMI